MSPRRTTALTQAVCTTDQPSRRPPPSSAARCAPQRRQLVDRGAASQAEALARARDPQHLVHPRMPPRSAQARTGQLGLHPTRIPPLQSRRYRSRANARRENGGLGAYRCKQVNTNHGVRKLPTVFSNGDRVRQTRTNVPNLRRPPPSPRCQRAVGLIKYVYS
jgi:hypothetical protein